MTYDSLCDDFTQFNAILHKFEFVIHCIKNKNFRVIWNFDLSLRLLKEMLFRLSTKMTQKPKHYAQDSLKPTPKDYSKALCYPWLRRWMPSRTYSTPVTVFCSNSECAIWIIISLSRLGWAPVFRRHLPVIDWVPYHRVLMSGWESLRVPVVTPEVTHLWMCVGLKRVQLVRSRLAVTARKETVSGVSV